MSATLNLSTANSAQGMPVQVKVEGIKLDGIATSLKCHKA